MTHDLLLIFGGFGICLSLWLALPSDGIRLPRLGTAHAVFVLGLAIGSAFVSVVVGAL